MCHNNIWGSVCGQGFDFTDAYVVCKELDLGISGDVHLVNEVVLYFIDYSLLQNPLSTQTLTLEMETFLLCTQTWAVMVMRTLCWIVPKKSLGLSLVQGITLLELPAKMVS